MYFNYLSAFNIICRYYHLSNLRESISRDSKCGIAELSIFRPFLALFTLTIMKRNLVDKHRIWYNNTYFIDRTYLSSYLNIKWLSPLCSVAAIGSHRKRIWNIVHIVCYVCLYCILVQSTAENILWNRYIYIFYSENEHLMFK